MPEGHVAHRQVVDQAPGLVGRLVAATAPSGRLAPVAAAVDGRMLQRMEAWGKNVFYFFPGRRVLHVHLGMDGRFRVGPAGPVGAGRADGGPPDLRSAGWEGAGRAGGSRPDLRLASEATTVDLTRPQVCRVIDELRQRQIVAGLGPDPIRTDDDGGRVLPRLAAFDGPIGVALLDQSVVAGIGNAYRAEILFVCGVHPERPAAAVSADEWASMWAAAVRLLRMGVELNAIATIDRRERRPGGRRSTYVYGQHLCLRCGGPIRWWDLAGREAYACEACQPPP